MKTLAKQKIKEREEFLLSRIKHRAFQYNDGEISFEDFLGYKESYTSQFKGYVRAFLDMELLTDEEQKQILSNFLYSVVKLKSEIS